MCEFSMCWLKAQVQEWSGHGQEVDNLSSISSRQVELQRHKQMINTPPCALPLACIPDGTVLQTPPCVINVYIEAATFYPHQQQKESTCELFSMCSPFANIPGGTCMHTPPCLIFMYRQAHLSTLCKLVAHQCSELAHECKHLHV